MKILTLSLNLTVFLYQILPNAKALNNENNRGKAVAATTSQILQDLQCHFNLYFDTTESEQVGLATLVLSQNFVDTMIITNQTTNQQLRHTNFQPTIINMLRRPMMRYTRFSQCYLFLMLITSNNLSKNVALIIAKRHHLNPYDFNNYYIFHNPSVTNGQPGIINDTFIIWLRNKVEIILDSGENPKEKGGGNLRIQIFTICFYCGVHNEAIIQHTNEINYSGQSDQKLSTFEAFPPRLGSTINGHTVNLYGFTFELTESEGQQKTCEKFLSDFDWQVFFPSKKGEGTKYIIGYIFAFFPLKDYVSVYWMGLLFASIGQQMNFSCVVNSKRHYNYNGFENPYLTLQRHTVEPDRLFNQHYFPVTNIEALMFYCGNPKEYTSLFPQQRAFDFITWIGIVLAMLGAIFIYTLTEYVVEKVAPLQELKSKRSFNRILLEGIEESIRLILSQSVNETSCRSFSHKYYFLPMFLLSTIILIGSFSGTIVKQGTVPTFYDVPTTIEELAESNFSAGIQPWDFESIKHLSVYKENGSFAKKFEFLELVDKTAPECLAETYNQNKVCFTLNSIAENSFTRLYSDENGNLLFQSGKERIGVYYRVPKGQKYAPYSGALDSQVYRLFAGGLTNYWYGRELEEFRKDGRWRAQTREISVESKREEINSSQKVIGLDYIKGWFFQLGFGLLLALIIYILEHLIHSCLSTPVIVLT